MGYRDEGEGIRVRMKDLEGELEEAKKEILRLRGEASASAEEPSGDRSLFLGEPMHVRKEEVLPFSVSDRGFEAIAEMIRERLPPSVVPSQVGGTLSVRTPTFSLSFKNTDDGQAVFRMEGRFHEHRNASYFLAGLFGTLGTFLGAGLAISAGLHPEHILWIAPTAISGGTFLGRHLSRRIVRQQRAMLRGLLETAITLAEEHKIETLEERRQVPKVRVAPAEQQEEMSVPEELSVEEAEPTASSE